MTNTTHPAQPVAEFKGYVDGEPAVTWLDRDNMPRVGTKLFTQAAANKAAEEGGLPDTIDTREFRELLAKAMDAAELATRTGDPHRDYKPARDALVGHINTRLAAADRASRQVANKAEVEPVAYMSADKKMLVFVDAMDVLKFNRSGMTPLFATPPATTGASTAARPTDDELWDATLRDRDAYHEWADKLAEAIAKHFDVDIGEHSNQNLPWAEALEAIENAESVGASTVLTDERENCPNCYADREDSIGCADCDGTGTIAREVAAQAGQVAVPDFRNVTAVKRISDQSLTITFASCASCSKFERAAAPSPAKESK